jgi:predicted lysophospholipase L1 biosynthesis ABC-type transport system permease subunit
VPAAPSPAPPPSKVRPGAAAPAAPAPPTRAPRGPAVTPARRGLGWSIQWARSSTAQFLTEAVLLTSLGGVIGIGFGLGTTLGSKQLLPTLVDDFPGPILSVSPVLLAFGVSVLIGVVAGSYPAYRAARMRPIDALRFE